MLTLFCKFLWNVDYFFFYDQVTSEQTRPLVFFKNTEETMVSAKVIRAVHAFSPCPSRAYFQTEAEVTYESNQSAWLPLTWAASKSGTTHRNGSIHHLYTILHHTNASICTFWLFLLFMLMCNSMGRKSKWRSKGSDCVSACSVTVPVTFCLVAEASGQDSQHLMLDRAGII